MTTLFNTLQRKGKSFSHGTVFYIPGSASVTADPQAADDHALIKNIVAVFWIQGIRWIQGIG